MLRVCTDGLIKSEWETRVGDREGTHPRDVAWYFSLAPLHSLHSRASVQHSGKSERKRERVDVAEGRSQIFIDSCLCSTIYGYVLGTFYEKMEVKYVIRVSSSLTARRGEREEVFCARKKTSYLWSKIMNLYIN